ncbi:MAG: NAD(P)-binding domain-containing protein [Candidatus Saccharimonadales bacterium]|nr:8-hydroxy-5-deazaflavin:NADPH oxidoreductase [Patescibacteria group bacterium]
MPKQIHTISILGAGKLGITIAQLALKAGYRVYIAGSGSEDKIRLSVSILAPGAVPTTTEHAAQMGDIVILALPLGKYRTIPSRKLKEKLVIDAMNYWWEVDGNADALKNPQTSTSEIVQQYLPDARVVKAISHMGYHHLRDEAQAAGAQNRKALAIAGNHRSDVEQVSEFIDRLGFDPLPIGELHNGRQLEPGHAAFGANLSKDSLASLLL